jgi:hypothetical protein
MSRSAVSGDDFVRAAEEGIRKAIGEVLPKIRDIFFNPS